MKGEEKEKFIFYRRVYRPVNRPNAPWTSWFIYTPWCRDIIKNWEQEGAIHEFTCFETQVNSTEWIVPALEDV